MRDFPRNTDQCARSPFSKQTCVALILILESRIIMASSEECLGTCNGSVSFSNSTQLSPLYWFCKYNYGASGCSMYLIFWGYYPWVSYPNSDLTKFTLSSLGNEHKISHFLMRNVSKLVMGEFHSATQLRLTPFTIGL